MKSKSKIACTFFRNLPRTLKENYKAYCDRRGITMRQDFIEHMKSAVEQDLKSFQGDKK